MKRAPQSVIVLLIVVLFVSAPRARAQTSSNDYVFNDSHFHLTNYIQEGIDIHDFLKIMGNKAGRVALFGIPLQQQWSYRVDEDRGPTYYLNSDAPLYYYSFTDAWIATAYKSLSKEEQARFDPMITGFNPTDMYAADHIGVCSPPFPEFLQASGSSAFIRNLCQQRSRVKWRVFRIAHSIVCSTLRLKSGWLFLFTTTLMFHLPSPALNLLMRPK